MAYDPYFTSSLPYSSLRNLFTILDPFLPQYINSYDSLTVLYCRRKRSPSSSSSDEEVQKPTKKEPAKKPRDSSSRSPSPPPKQKEEAKKKKETPEKEKDSSQKVSFGFDCYRMTLNINLSDIPHIQFQCHFIQSKINVKKNF